MKYATFKEAFPSFANNLRKQALKYAVQRTIFCPHTGNILDMRTAIMIDVEDENGKTLFCEVVSPALLDKLQNAKDNVLKIHPTASVKFYSCNKKLKSELITLL